MGASEGGAGCPVSRESAPGRAWGIWSSHGPAESPALTAPTDPHRVTRAPAALVQALRRHSTGV